MNTKETEESLDLRSMEMKRTIVFIFLLLVVSVCITKIAAFSFLGNLQIPSLEKIKLERDAEKKFGKKRLCVITGTSSGLGKHTASQLLKDGNWHVIGAVRDMDKMAAVAEVEGFDMNNFTPMQCDLASFDSTRQFAANLIDFIKGKPLDRFVCNAAVYQPSLPHAKWSEDNIEQSLQINHLSHFLLCSLFIPIMRDAVKPRVIMVGSVTGNDNTVGGGGVYPIADLHDMKGE